MRGREADRGELADFVSARTAELHRTAYLLTADQERAEQLVNATVHRLDRDRTSLGRGGAVARTYMARLAATVDEPNNVADRDDATAEHTRYDAIARMSPRQRAVLMLRSVDRLDERSTSRDLGLAGNAVGAAEKEASLALGAAVDTDECQTALLEFADLATWPEPAVTLTAAAQVTPPRRRSPWRYVAVAAVLVIGAAVPITSQIHHDRWLQTPEGINSAHGTHFHAYTQGFKLVGVQHVPADATRTPISASSGQALALSCRNSSVKSQSTWPHLSSGDDSFSQVCARQSAKRYDLSLPEPNTVISAPRKGHEPVDVAIYEPVAWNHYPIAHDHFEVEHDLDLDAVVTRLPDNTRVRRGTALTLRGTNGTVTGTVDVPAGAKDTVLVLSGLLSPTTTGQYRIKINGEAVSDCSLAGSIATLEWCRLYDRYVPQIPFGRIWGVGDPGDLAPRRTAKVTVQARDVRGPWKLQLRYDRYRSTN